VGWVGLRVGLGCDCCLTQVVMLQVLMLSDVFYAQSKEQVEHVYSSPRFLLVCILYSIIHYQSSVNHPCYVNTVHNNCSISAGAQIVSQIRNVEFWSRYKAMQNTRRRTRSKRKQTSTQEERVKKMNDLALDHAECLDMHRHRRPPLHHRDRVGEVRRQRRPH